MLNNVQDVLTCYIYSDTQWSEGPVCGPYLDRGVPDPRKGFKYIFVSVVWVAR